MARHNSSIHELRRSRHTDQPSPSPRSDQLPYTGALEVPRHGVAARTRALVDDHHLRTENALGLHRVGSRPVGDRTERFAIQDLGDIGCQQAAGIEPLVHNSRLLTDLRVEVPVERGQSTVAVSGM